MQPDCRKIQQFYNRLKKRKKIALAASPFPVPVDIIAPVSELMVVGEGQQTVFTGQPHARACRIRIRRSQNRCLQLLLLVNRGCFFENFAAEFTAADRGDIGDRGLFGGHGLETSLNVCQGADY